MKVLVEDSKRAWQSLGKVTYGTTKDESASLEHRRSLYIVKDVEEGELVTTENVRSIRPGKGLSPKYFERTLGMKFQKSFKKGTPLSWDCFK